MSPLEKKEYIFGFYCIVYIRDLMKPVSLYLKIVPLLSDKNNGYYIF